LLLMSRLPAAASTYPSNRPVVVWSITALFAICYLLFVITTKWWRATSCDDAG
jgi:hypothetical protein